MPETQPPIPGVATAERVEQLGAATQAQAAPPVLSAKQIRLRAGLSQTAAATLAGVAVGSYRAFELDEVNGTTRKVRARCRGAVAKMANASEAA